MVILTKELVMATDNQCSVFQSPILPDVPYEDIYNNNPASHTKWKKKAPWHT